MCPLATSSEQFNDGANFPTQFAETFADLLEADAMAFLGNADLFESGAVAFLGGVDGAEHVVDRAYVVVELADPAG